MKTYTNELLNNSELMDALHSMELSFELISQDYDKKKELVGKETDQMVKEYQNVERIISKINKKGDDLNSEYYSRERNIKEWFGFDNEYVILLPASIIPLLYFHPWTGNEGFFGKLFVTLIVWLFCAAPIYFFILYPAMLQYEKYMKAKIEKERKLALAALKPQLSKEIARVVEQHPIYRQYSSWESLLDSRYDNAHQDLINEESEKRKSVAQKFDHVYPAYLLDTVEPALKWIKYGQVKTISELLDKAEALKAQHDHNYSQWKLEQSEKAFQETTLYKNRQRQLEEARLPREEPEDTYSYYEPKEEQLSDVQLEKKRRAEIDEEVTKQYQEQMALFADNARRWGEDRDKVKEWDQLAGRGLQERVDADRKWDYREDDHNSERGGSY